MSLKLTSFVAFGFVLVLQSLVFASPGLDPCAASKDKAKCQADLKAQAAAAAAPQVLDKALSDDEICRIKGFGRTTGKAQPAGKIECVR